MRPFRFRLEALHTLRSWEEERAREACGQALRQEHRLAGDLRAVEQRIDEDVDAWRRSQEQTLPAAARARRWTYLQALERERNDAAQKLSTARRIREQKMKLLVDAHRRVQVLDALKTRQRDAHLAEERRREERELEDLINARFQPDI